jgi:signal transduction histidine kinase
MVLLETNEIFGQLPAEQREAIKQACQERSYTSGQAIFREGDAGDGSYLIKSGSVEISVVVDGQGERKVFAREGPGALFGEMAMVDNQPRSASAIAREETTAYFIPREAILAAMTRSPEFMTRLMRVITQRLREFNRQFVDEVLQAERLALVGRFTRSIVHDLKNPLNVIGIAADMAASERATPEMRHSGRERIRKQINRISALVNEVVEFTRGSHATFILAPVDFDRLILQAVDDIRDDLKMSSIELELVNEPPPVKVPANPERLLRVFHNLCANAAEAMPDGGIVRFDFSVERNRVMTSVTDTGPGIAPEIAGKLFEAFVTFGKPNGTGLGLSICQRIVEDHRGRISCENSPDGGACFKVSLPVIPTHD